MPRLTDVGHAVTLLFANSNIDTEAEFERRKAEAARLAEIDGVGFVALPYDHADWLREVAVGYEQEPEKGRRCERCFRYNLSRAAEFAAANGYEAVTTSLTVSPHKVSPMVFAAGDESCRNRQVKFLHEDFKKREGFKLSVRRTAELGLYRQVYCGCEFSRRAREKTEER